MFNTLAFQGVDAIQSAKKQFVSTFVQHDQFKDILNGFIDAQASYTKDAITASSVATTKVVEILTDRTPYVEAAKKVQEWFPMTNCATPSKKAK